MERASKGKVKCRGSLPACFGLFYHQFTRLIISLAYQLPSGLLGDWHINKKLHDHITKSYELIIY